MREETLSYQADGLHMESQLYFEPRAGQRPGVLVFPEAFGLGERSIRRAKALAAMGYVALACDLHGDARFIPGLADAMGALKVLFDDPTRTRARALAAMDALMARPEVDAANVATIGYCFPMPLELARSGAALKAAIGFHTGLATVAPVTEPGSIKARVLVCIGADDPTITSGMRAAFESEMRAVGADWQMIVYGGTVHSFTNPQAGRLKLPDVVRYSAKADARSWRAMVDLLRETLGS